MSKRKNRTSSPNIPQATLDRAREQLTGEPAPPPPVEKEPVRAAAPEPNLKRATAAPVASTTTRTRRRTTERSSSARSSRGSDRMDMEMIRERLDNPTRIVSEDELRTEYNYVLRDLRSMGILAAALAAALVVIAQFL